MLVDPEFLRQHYASLSDEGLLAIERADLVEAAQKCYDDELRRRELSAPPAVPQDDADDEAIDAAEDGAAAFDTGDKPEWLEEASEVYSRGDLPGSAPAPELVDARDALEAEGIPCYLELTEVPAEEGASGQPAHVWRLLVPGDLNMHASSVLDRDIFNADFVAEWRTHLETFSDDELRAMDPKVVFCGLFDRVERVTKAYEEEMARRGR